MRSDVRVDWGDEGFLLCDCARCLAQTRAHAGGVLAAAEIVRGMIATEHEVMQRAKSAEDHEMVRTAHTRQLAHAASFSALMLKARRLQASLRRRVAKSNSDPHSNASHTRSEKPSRGTP